MATTKNITSSKTTTSNKGAAAPKGNGQAAQAADPNDEAAEVDAAYADIVEGDATGKERAESFKKLPRHLQYAVKMRTVLKRVKDHAVKCGNWEQVAVTDAFVQAGLAMQGLIEQLEALPDDFRPPSAQRRASAKKNVEVGGLVDIRVGKLDENGEGKIMKLYDGIIGEADKTALKVLLISSGYVKVQLNEPDEEGIQQTIVVPRSHVKPHTS